MIDVSLISTTNHFIYTLHKNIFIKRVITDSTLNTSEVQLRDFSFSSYKSIDSKPYGGQHGQIIKIENLIHAIRILSRYGLSTRKILLDPSGTKFNQSIANKLSRYERLIFISSRYEGFDSRLYHYIDESISLGSFIISNGELASQIILDCVLRLIPGTISNFNSVIQESFQHNNQTIEQNHYSQPRIFEHYNVPTLLCSGNHPLIRKHNVQNSIFKSSINKNLN